MKISEQCLERFNKNKTDIVRRRFITMDETWIHHYTPESKQQSKQWTEAGCSAPEKTRSFPSVGKVMAPVFWDAEGILFIDYLEKGKTITGEYYSNLLTRLDEKILFPKLKLFLAGQHFSSNQEAIAAVEGYFADLTKNHYRDGIMALEHRWNKCISLKGDYVEK